MSTYSTNPKPRVSRHVVANHPKPKTMDDGEVQIFIREHNIANRSVYKAQYCMAQANLKRGNKVAKKEYKQNFGIQGGHGRGYST